MRCHTIAGLLVGVAALWVACPVHAQAAATEAAAEGKLEATTIDLLSYENESLENVLRAISKRAGLSILVDAKQVDAKSMTVTVELSDVTAKNALNIILRLKGLTRQFDNGVIWVTTKEDARANPKLTTILYEVRDITMVIQNFQAPEVKLKEDNTTAQPRIQPADPDPVEKRTDIDELMDLIQTQIEPDVWGENGVAISRFGGNLTITATREIHRKVAALLDQLRAAK